MRPIAVGSGLTPNLLNHSFSGQYGGIHRCYAQALAAVPSLAGSAVVHFVITSTGHPGPVAVNHDAALASVTRCVSELIGDMVLPAPSAGVVTVILALEFKP
jgi:cyanate permease